MPASVVQSGNYTMQLDLGFDWGAFTLDHAVKGVLDNNIYLLGPTGVTTVDISESVTDISYRRGRRKADYQAGAGTMTFTMVDTTGELGPYDTQSIYYDVANNEPGLAPLKQVKLIRDATDIFTGIITGYEYNFQLAGPQEVSVQCADEFYKLAQTNMDELNVTAQTSGQRITTVLALPEVDYTGATNIDLGTVDLGHDAAYTVPLGTNVLQYLQQINEAEQGRLFVAANGDLTFQQRGSVISGATASFKDDGTGYDYFGLGIEYDSDSVINRTYVKALDGKESSDSDSASIAKYFTQTKSITNSLLHVQSQIDDLAAYLLNPSPQPRYTGLSTTFSRLSNAQRDVVATIDIGDTISITKTIPGLNTPLESELVIEGIDGRITVSRGHQITFYTNETSIIYGLILDDLTFGVLDQQNGLA